MISACEDLSGEIIEKMPWSQKRTINQIRGSARQYLKDVKSFLIKGFLVPTKCLSFHLKEVACFTKGKLGKKYQFGRAFQLARIGGNFFVVGKRTLLQMPDKTSVSAIVKEHENLFDRGKIKSVDTDKVYHSGKNEKILAKKAIAADRESRADRRRRSLQARVSRIARRGYKCGVKSSEKKVTRSCNFLTGIGAASV